MDRIRKRIRLLGIDIDNIDMEETINRIEDLIKKKKPSLVVTPNVHHINILQKDNEFRKIYKHASIVIPDGIPLLWLSRILGAPLKERVAGSDLLPLFSKIAAEKKYKLFFLGAAPGIAKKAAESLIQKNPGLTITGTYSPYFGFENNEKENKKIVCMIKKCNPDVLFVCLGPPKQEKWSWKYMNKINVPVVICAGAAFDFIALKMKRAPKWMQNCGLEWLHRLFQEPRRLWKRYLIGNTSFILLGIKEIIRIKIMKKYFINSTR